jgi:serine/threonine-protein kinase RsbW
VAQQRAMVEVPASSRGPGIARDVLTDALHAWHYSDLGDDAALIATELITNAVQHAPPADIVELELTLTDDVLRISVVDGSAVQPLITEMTEDRPTGRGMRIVEALADRWGPTPTGMASACGRSYRACLALLNRQKSRRVADGNGGGRVRVRARSVHERHRPAPPSSLARRLCDSALGVCGCGCAYRRESRH